MSAANSNVAEVKAMLTDMAAEAQDLKQAAGGSVTDSVAGWLAPQYALVARKLGYILAGGSITAPQTVPEQYLLDLEREAFVSLCGERKTQERIAHTLKTGKPLRN